MCFCVSSQVTCLLKPTRRRCQGNPIISPRFASRINIFSLSDCSSLFYQASHFCLLYHRVITCQKLLTTEISKSLIFPPGFNVLFTRTRHWVIWIQSSPLHTLSLASVLMSSSYPPRGFFSSCLYNFRLKSISHCLCPPCVLQVHDCHMTGEEYVLWHLLLCNFVVLCYVRYLMPKSSRQYFILLYLQSKLFPPVHYCKVASKCKIYKINRP